MQQGAPQLRPMGLLEIIDQTFRLYRSNFWLFFGIAAVFYIPLAVLQQHGREGPIIGGVLGILAYLLVTGAMTKAVSDRYMGDQATVGGSYLYIGQRFGALILTVILAYLFVAAGLLLLIVGAIIFAFWVAFIMEVFVIEKKPYVEAISRSKFLIGQGVWAEVLALSFITGILALLIQGIGSLPLLVAQRVVGEHAPYMWVLEGVISGIAQTLALPVTVVGGILLYYDSRIRKEAFDLEVLARELGKELPPPSAPSQFQGPLWPSPPAAPSSPSAPGPSAPPEPPEASP